MARQKSEDRVVPDGGVMPAQPGRDVGQGKAVPVDETVVQLSLTIATADDHLKAPDRSGASRVVVPKAIVNAGTWTPVTVEEVVHRLTDALVKVVQNKGAPGTDGLSRSCASSGRRPVQRWPRACWMGAIGRG
jgi:hypothetical protein